MRMTGEWVMKLLYPHERSGTSPLWSLDNRHRSSITWTIFFRSYTLNSQRVKLSRQWIWPHCSMSSTSATASATYPIVVHEERERGISHVTWTHSCLLRCIFWACSSTYMIDLCMAVFIGIISVISQVLGLSSPRMAIIPTKSGSISQPTLV